MLDITHVRHYYQYVGSERRSRADGNGSQGLEANAGSHDALLGLRCSGRDKDVDTTHREAGPGRLVEEVRGLSAPPMGALVPAPIAKWRTCGGSWKRGYCGGSIPSASTVTTTT